MRALFLISAVFLHISLSYANIYDWNYGFHPYYYLTPPPISPDIVINPYQYNIAGFKDTDSNEPGEPAKQNVDEMFYSVSQSSYISTDDNGEVHKKGEATINDNGKITKFKLR
ncbi:uncharacterized protein LOC112050195 [Bicyclus anynana]|uniref:Uncharacterized protein LOC112050195 n=1 Tax=Bicyclus anynana TaxID=110368 RepID=A0A6J1NGQ6_BICAN|nr:uncharacterized protein LOC112050195 [Bicyclus anynana]